MSNRRHPNRPAESSMLGPFASMAALFLGGSLIASVGIGSLLPLVITVVAVAILVKVFAALDE